MAVQSTPDADFKMVSSPSTLQYSSPEWPHVAIKLLSSFTSSSQLSASDAMNLDEYLLMQNKFAMISVGVVVAEVDVVGLVVCVVVPEVVVVGVVDGVVVVVGVVVLELVAVVVCEEVTELVSVVVGVVVRLVVAVVVALVV